MVGLGAVKDRAHVGGAADLEGVAVEVFGPEGQDLAEAEAGVGERRGLMQEALASEAGTTLSTLSVIERGLANPTWATVRDIAAALGISLNELAKRAEKHE